MHRRGGLKPARPMWREAVEDMYMVGRPVGSRARSGHAPDGYVGRTQQLMALSRSRLGGTAACPE